jgi:hypothetical protein
LEEVNLWWFFNTVLTYSLVLLLKYTHRQNSINGSYRAGCLSGNARFAFRRRLVLISGGTPAVMRGFVVFLSFQANYGMVSLVGHDGFLPNPSQFIIHLSS